MDEKDKKKQIEFYIGKLQAMLSKVIVESKEFQELKKIAGSDDSDMQLCIFSVMMDKHNISNIKNLDMDMIQKMLLEASDMFENEDSLSEENMWNEDDMKFLKQLKIVL